MIDTARALSSASPTLPIDADSPCSVRDSVNLTDVYLLPAPTSAIRHRRSTTEFADAVEAIAHRAAVNFVAYPVGVPRARRRSHPHRSGPGPVPPPILRWIRSATTPTATAEAPSAIADTPTARRPRSVRWRAGNKSGLRIAAPGPLRTVRATRRCARLKQAARATQGAVRAVWDSHLRGSP
jgi:hypothetical protein